MWYSCAPIPFHSSSERLDLPVPSTTRSLSPFPQRSKSLLHLHQLQLVLLPVITPCSEPGQDPAHPPLPRLKHNTTTPYPSHSPKPDHNGDPHSCEFVRLQVFESSMARRLAIGGLRTTRMFDQWRRLEKCQGSLEELWASTDT